MIKLATDDPKQQHLTLDAVKMEADDWVFGCKERKALHMNLLKTRREEGYTHIVVAAPSGSKGTRVNIDVYGLRERWISYAVPKWVTFWREFPIVETTAAGAVFYNISLTGMENPWQAYSVKALPVQCSTPGEGEKPHFGLAKFFTPWAMDSTQTLLGQGGNFTNSITAKLQTARPEGSNDTTATPQIHLFLDPACTYRVTVRAAFPEMMGQLVRLHLPMLLPCAAAVLIMVVAFQLRRIEQDRTVKSTILTLASCVSPVNVVLPSRLVAYVAALGPIAAFLPVTDITTLQSRNLDFGLLPIMMFFLAIAVVLVLCCLAWGAVVLFGTVVHKAVVRAAGGVAPTEVVADVAVSTLQRFPTILAVLLVAVAAATCGSLALCLGCLAFFLRLFKMYEEYLESIVKRSVGLKDEDDSDLLLGIHFQFTLGMLWALTTLLNLPTLVAWTQNIQHGVALPADPSLIHAVILCSSLAILWQNDGKPRVEKKYYAVLAIILQAVGIFIGSFALLTIYRVNFAISTVFVAISSHQLVGPDREPKEETQQAEAVSSESEGEIEVALPAGEEGDGVEGLDWEYEELPEGAGYITVSVPYPQAVGRRLVKLPAQFFNDLAAVFEEAGGLGWTV